MSELTLWLLRLGFLVLLWIFVLVALRLLRSDLFGAKVHIPEMSLSSTDKNVSVAVVEAQKLPEAKTSSATAKILTITKGEALDLADLPLTPPRMVIGRSPECDVVLTDAFVSSQHAELVYDGSGWRITDLASSNGTLLGGKRLAPHAPAPIPLGAKIRLGGTVMKLKG